MWMVPEIGIDSAAVRDLLLHNRIHMFLRPLSLLQLARDEGGEISMVLNSMALGQPLMRSLRIRRFVLNLTTIPEEKLP